MPPEKEPNREAEATDALIAFSLAHFDAETLTDEEILEVSKNGPLSDEARKIIANFKPHRARAPEESAARVAEAEMAGMYRSGSDGTLDAKVKEEIERKRAELRERLRRKKLGDV